jgi:hypothetical protein
MADQQPPPAAAMTTASGVTAVRLNPCWTNSPAAWFRATDAQFVIRRVTCPLEKFFAVLTALSANVDRVRHMMEADPTEDFYINLKEGLAASHVMSDNQKIDQLLHMEPLNWQKPSDMLVEMDKLKLADVQQYFAYMCSCQFSHPGHTFLRGVTAANMAKAFVAAWVARLGVSATITSDREVKFALALWAATMKGQSNGLKEALKVRLAGADWPAHPICCLGCGPPPVKIQACQLRSLWL